MEEGFVIYSPKGIMLLWTIRATQFECRDHFSKFYKSTWETLTKKKGYTSGPVIITKNNHTNVSKTPEV